MVSINGLKTKYRLDKIVYRHGTVMMVEFNLAVTVLRVQSLGLFTVTAGPGTLTGTMCKNDLLTK